MHSYTYTSKYDEWKRKSEKLLLESTDFREG